MIRRPPRSPLFPYPTFFRSVSFSPGDKWLGDRPPASDRFTPDEAPAASPGLGAAFPGRFRGEPYAATPSPSFEDRTSPVKTDRKSTRLNSSLSQISYAVFCL